MLDLLPASSSHPEITPRSVLTAIAVHLLVVGFDVAATRSLVNATKASDRAEPVLLLMPHSAEPLPQAELPRNPRVGPPPERFQHIPLPVEVPPVIPPIDWSRRPFDPRGFLRLGPRPAPKSPPVLPSAGRAGNVLLVRGDTAGGLETGSVRIIESSHRGFEEAAADFEILGDRIYFVRANHQRDIFRA